MTKKVNYGLTSKRYLGRLCIRNHKYKDTDKTVRNIKSDACVICCYDNRKLSEARKYFGQVKSGGTRGTKISNTLIKSGENKMRTCLCCNKNFMSSFNGNRVCSNCKQDKDKQNEKIGYSVRCGYKIQVQRYGIRTDMFLGDRGI